MNLGKQVLVLVRFTAMRIITDTKNLPYTRIKAQYVAPSSAVIKVSWDYVVAQNIGPGIYISVTLTH